jgi:hypothetical protein
MLFIDRPISAESHVLLPTPSPLSLINYAGNPRPVADSSCCLALILQHLVHEPMLDVAAA